MARDKTKERKERKDVFLDPWMIEAIDKIYGGNGKYSEFCRKAVEEKLIKEKTVKALKNMSHGPCIGNEYIVSGNLRPSTSLNDHEISIKVSEKSAEEVKEQLINLIDGIDTDSPSEMRTIKEGFNIDLNFKEQ